jgi:carbamoyl-phosphate synthase large subunit
MKKNILVTGIGGNVGQGILRNIRSSEYDINLIGCSIEDITPSSYLCNNTYIVPYAVASNYLDTIKNICTVEKIDLIIPSTDHEVLELSKYIDQLPKIACNPLESAEIFFDKYETFLHFEKNNIPFAKAFLPSKYKGELKNIIAKPRAGRGSRGIEFNPLQFNQFSDEEYMIQELHKGVEITTAFYVDLKGEFIGSISLARTLVNGTTTFCSVNNAIAEKINIIIKKIINCTSIIGSSNIQFILTNEGDIYPFEINGRISGTNSIRSNFGFNDVIWTVEEHLYNKKISKDLKITKGSATRILLDVIFPESDLESINNNTKHLIF